MSRRSGVKSCRGFQSRSRIAPRPTTGALLADLFRGRSQLFVYHMFRPDRARKGRNETGSWWHRHDEYAELKAKHSDDLGTGGCSLG